MKSIENRSSAADQWAYPMKLGDRRLDLDAQVLRDREGAVVPLRPQAWQVLCLLAANAGRVVTKGHLLDAVWPGRVVTDGSLAQAVRDVRSALGASGRDLVRTVARRGYMIIPSTTREVRAVRERSLCAATGGLIGREQALHTVFALLGEHRLVTVLGPGGIGKTQLARAVAFKSDMASPDGVWWVDLTPLSRPDELAAAIAAVTRLGQASDGVEPLVRACGGLQALLVLDNCEHLVDSVAELARALLAAGARLRLLVTSQAPLRIDEEHVYRLQALAVPQEDVPLSQALEFGAIELFVRQARAADSRFDIDARNIGTVVRLCRQLDGNPLAIKLAASRTPLFGVDGLAAHLTQRLDVLSGTNRDSPARQRSLEAAFDWSYHLLRVEEQRMFRAMGIFGGPFSIDWLAEVVEPNDAAPKSLITILGELADRSFVELDSSAHARWRVLESARAYAIDRLAAAGEASHTLSRHAASCVRRLERRAAELYSGALSRDAFVAARREEMDNLRTAMKWALDGAGDARVALALLHHAAPFCEDLGIKAEALRWLAALAQAISKDATSDEAAQFRCATIHWTASWTGARPAVRDNGSLPFGSADLVPLSDTRRQAHALCVRAREEIFEGRGDAARETLDAAIALEESDWPVWLRVLPLHVHSILALLARPADAEAALSAALRMLESSTVTDHATVFALQFNRALNSWLQGRWDEAADRFEALATAGRSQQRGSQDMCWLFEYLAIARLEQGRLDQARAATLEGLPHLRRAGVLPLGANGLALLAVRLGHPDVAARLIGANEAFLAQTGWRHNRIGARILEQAATLVEAICPSTMIEQWKLEGRSLDDDAIVHIVEQMMAPSELATT